MTLCCRAVFLKNKLDLFVIFVVRFSYGVADLMGWGHPPVDLVNTSSKYNPL